MAHLHSRHRLIEEDLKATSDAGRDVFCPASNLGTVRSVDGGCQSGHFRHCQTLCSLLLQVLLSLIVIGGMEKEN